MFNVIHDDDSKIWMQFWEQNHCKPCILIATNI